MPALAPTLRAAARAIVARADALVGAVVGAVATESPHRDRAAAMPTIRHS